MLCRLVMVSLAVIATMASGCARRPDVPLQANTTGDPAKDKFLSDIRSLINREAIFGDNIFANYGVVLKPEVQNIIQGVGPEFIGMSTSTDVWEKLGFKYRITYRTRKRYQPPSLEAVRDADGFMRFDNLPRGFRGSLVNKNAPCFTVLDFERYFDLWHLVSMPATDGGGVTYYYPRVFRGRYFEVSMGFSGQGREPTMDCVHSMSIGFTAKDLVKPTTG